MNSSDEFSEIADRETDLNTDWRPMSSRSSGAGPSAGTARTTSAGFRSGSGSEPLS